MVLGGIAPCKVPLAIPKTERSWTHFTWRQAVLYDQSDPSSQNYIKKAIDYYTAESSRPRHRGFHGIRAHFLETVGGGNSRHWAEAWWGHWHIMVGMTSARGRGCC